MSDSTSLYMQNPQLAQALFLQQQGANNLQQGMNPGPIRSPWQGLSGLAKALMGGLQLNDARSQMQGFAKDQNDYLSNAASFNPLANALAPQGQGAAAAQPSPLAGALAGKPPVAAPPSGGPTLPPQAAVEAGAPPSAQPAMASGNPLLSPDMTAATITGTPGGGGGAQPMPQAAPQPMAQPGAPNATQATAGIGTQSQQFQAAQQYMAKARQLMTGPYARDPRVQALAQSYAAQGQQLLSVGQWHTVTLNNGGQATQNSVTGEIKALGDERNTALNGRLFGPGGADLTGPVPQQPQRFTRPDTGAEAVWTPSGGTGQGAVTDLTGGSRGPNMGQTVNTDQAKEDAQTVAEEQHQALAGRDIYGNTNVIRSLAKNVPTGIGAEQKVQLGNVLTSLGMDPDKVKDWTGMNTTDGQLLQKKLFELVSTSVRAMGAREPGSVLMAFQRNYPSMASQPGTIDAMTRLLDMNQHYKEDVASAKGDYLNQAKNAMVQTGQYPGMGGFQAPDPKVYAASALEASGQPLKTWSTGLTPQQQVQAIQLRAKYFPDVGQPQPGAQ